jgi:hypothetical protein
MIAGGSNSTVTGGPGNDVVEGDPGVAGCSGGLDLDIIVDTFGYPAARRADANEFSIAELVIVP